MSREMRARELLATALAPKAKTSWDEDLAFAKQKGRSDEEAELDARRAHRRYVPEYNWLDALSRAANALDMLEQAGLVIVPKFELTEAATRALSQDTGFADEEGLTEAYRQMHEIARELGYPSILEALEDLDRLKALSLKGDADTGFAEGKWDVKERARLLVVDTLGLREGGAIRGAYLAGELDESDHVRIAEAAIRSLLPSSPVVGRDE